MLVSSVYQLHAFKIDAKLQSDQKHQIKTYKDALITFKNFSLKDEDWGYSVLNMQHIVKISVQHYHYKPADGALVWVKTNAVTWTTSDILILCAVVTHAFWTWCYWCNDKGSMSDSSKCVFFFYLKYTIYTAVFITATQSSVLLLSEYKSYRIDCIE